MTSNCFGQGKNNGSSIYVISYPKQVPKEVIDDIHNLLFLSTKRAWETQEDKLSNQGLILSIKISGNYKTGESCFINSDGSTYARFESPTVDGLIYGVYKYFRDLGFRFYLPDTLYTIVPSLKSVFKKKSVVETPFLRIRDFFGTGGFGSGKTDPDHSVEKDWQLWKWHNGFGTEFSLSGHVGETFNLANSQELRKNPSWTATPIIKNGQVDMSAKLNYFNSSAVNFFTDWVIRKYMDKAYVPPPYYIRDMVSIEPADGGGYLTVPPQGSDLKTISDQVFYAANVAAKKLDVLFPNQPNIGVNLYAYSDHADVPHFPLNPRVFVQIIPYQFQNVAFGPAFIKRWADKVKRFGLYDYFKYPDSNWDMPGGYTIDELMRRAINAVQAGSEGTTYESSYSKFSTAIPLWLLIQYMCSGDTNWKQRYEQLVKDLYGTAASSIKKLFDIFYLQVQFGPSQMDEALKYIDEAQILNKASQVALRINELKLYLIYVYLNMKSQDQQQGDLEGRLLPLVKMAWTLYETKILHSYRIMQLVSYAFLNSSANDKAHSEHYHELHLLTFPESDEPAALWKKNYRYTGDELNNLYNKIYASTKKSTLNTNPPSNISDQITAAKLEFYTAKKEVILQSNYTVRGYFSLFCEKPATILINWSMTNAKGEPPTATISGTDENYKSTYDYQLKSPTGKISISLPSGQSVFFINASPYTTYTLQLHLNSTFCYFDGSPREKINFLDNKGKPTYDPEIYPSYFYIPENAGEIQYRVQLNALQIIDPAGKIVSTKLLQTQGAGWEIRSFVPPANQTGKFWKAVISGNYNYQFLNIPDRYFLFEKK